MHELMVLAPVELKKVPAAHAVQVAAPEEDHVPATQLIQLVIAFAF